MTTSSTASTAPNADLDVLHERLNQIEARITTSDFLTCKGLGNEVPFHILDYPAEYELQVREYVELLCKALDNKHGHIRYARINLFQLIVDLLEKRKLLTKAFDMQRNKGSDALKRNLRGVLEESKIAKAIVEAAPPAEYDLVLVDGIGTAWPLIRAHQVISGLEPYMDQTPCVFFYPGTYTGLNLRLFDRIDSQDHYRAFRLVN
jgi:hypothetical protein